METKSDFLLQLETFARERAQSEEALLAAIRGLDHELPSIRWAAADVLKHHADPRRARALARMIQSDEVDLILKGLSSLKNAPLPGFEDSVIPLVHHGHPDIAPLAIDTLGYIGTSRCESALRQIKETNDRGLSVVARRSLRQIHDAGRNLI